MKNGFLIYGCYGYTGKLISEFAVKQGMTPVLAGRDEVRTKALANELNLPYRVFDLSNEEEVIDNIKDVKVVLHCAGPFIYTSEKMANACIKAKTHYLDITGEIDVFENLYTKDKVAQNAGVLLMSGVGFDVVPSDCLALFLKEELPDAVSLEMVLLQKGGMLSHGTAITIAENAAEKCMIRRNGKIIRVSNGTLTREVDFGDKTREAVAISWGDVASAYRSTNIPNITIYNALPKKVINSMKWGNYFSFILRNRFVKNQIIKAIKQRPAGPDETTRNTASSAIYGEVKNAEGKTKRAILELPEGYLLTALTALKVTQNILNAEPPHGAKTPAQIFGKDFILQFEKVKRVVLNG